MVDVEKNELTELVLIAKNLDMKGLVILKSQANALLSYEELKKLQMKVEVEKPGQNCPDDGK